jgi:UTP--glucose-1-phosphate uridylyltransferase
MANTKVRKAVIAAAGFGTRFLPQTKAMPKEMLPLVDKPIIQYVVEELVEAGIEDIIIVSNYSKRSIEDHFDQPNQDLVANLRAGGPKKQPYLDQITAISNLANFAFVRQKGPYGSSTPLFNASHLIGDEPFIYAFADDLIEATPNRFKQMIDLYDELQGNILPCVEVSRPEEYERYGIVAGDHVRDGVIKMSQLAEKPGQADAPSNFASVGGYLLKPDVLKYLEGAAQNLPADQEFYLTTYVLDPMIKDGHDFYACKIDESKYHDTGNKIEYLKTVVDYALKHEDVRDEFYSYLQQTVNRQK